MTKESFSHMFTNFTEWRAFRKAKKVGLLHLKVDSRPNAETSGERTRTWQRGTWTYRNIWVFSGCAGCFQEFGASL